MQGNNQHFAKIRYFREVCFEGLKEMGRRILQLIRQRKETRGNTRKCRTGKSEDGLENK